MRSALSFVCADGASASRMTSAGFLASLALSLSLSCALLAPAARAATDAPAVAAAAAADDQALLEFAQAAPVTSSEHDRIAAEIRDGMRSNPDQIQKADATLRGVLAKIPALKPADAETIREELRIRLAMLPQSTLEWQILESHDPTVASDRARRAVVTAHTIYMIGRATLWLSKQLAIAGPGADFVKTETAYIGAHFAQFTVDQQDACAHIARNMAASVKSYESLSPEERNARLARSRSVVNGSVPLDAVAVLAMASGYAQTSAETRFLATSAALFHLQNTNQLVMGLEGLRSGQVAPQLHY